MQDEPQDQLKENESPHLSPDFYIEKGLYVFTEAYHLKRGTCCGNNCRHCPWPNKNLDQDQKSQQ